MFSRIFGWNKAEQQSGGSRLGYMPALDGLRALAVLAVLFYHADVLWLPGGYLGVEVFFVVSGYLITSLLLAEYRANNSVSLVNFWQRRARRLLPALFALLIAVLVYAVIFLPEEVASLRADVLAAFAYVTNWYLISAQESYFEVMGRPSLLRHLWSLAVEEQFYLLWPLIFAFLLVRFRSRMALILLMIGATASALLMGLLYQPDTDPSRIYYGTDTRAAGLLIGAALAFVIRRPSEGRFTQLKRWSLDIVGILALGGLVFATLYLSEFDPFLYQGGMLLVAGATALVIAAAVSSNSPIFASVLGIGILRFIGLRSYSLYLWHWPVFMVTRPQLDTTLEGTPLLLFRFAVTFALAELSFRLIETPVRKGTLGKTWNTFKEAKNLRQFGMAFGGTVVAAALVFGAFQLGSIVIQAQPVPEPDYLLQMTAEDEAVSFEQAQLGQESSQETAGLEQGPVTSDMTSVSLILPEESENAKPAPDLNAIADNWVMAYRSNQQPLINSIQQEILALRTDRIENGYRVAPAPQNCNEKCQLRLEYLQLKEGMIRNVTPGARPTLPKIIKPEEPKTQVAVAVPKEVPFTRPEDAVAFAIGDSVMLGASNYLRRNIELLDVDAKLGRQVSAALQLLNERKDANLLPKVVIVHLGNNGTFSEKQFDEMMTVLQDVPRVIFLTNKVPRKWQEPNNYALTEGVKRYPNAYLIDWNSFSSLHPEYFWNDGIHLRPEGAQVYAALIAEIATQPIP